MSKFPTEEELSGVITIADNWCQNSVYDFLHFVENYNSGEHKLSLIANFGDEDETSQSMTLDLIIKDITEKICDIPEVLKNISDLVKEFRGYLIATSEIEDHYRENHLVDYGIKISSELINWELYRHDLFGLIAGYYYRIQSIGDTEITYKDAIREYFKNLPDFDSDLKNQNEKIEEMITEAELVCGNKTPDGFDLCEADGKLMLKIYDWKVGTGMESSKKSLVTYSEIAYKIRQSVYKNFLCKVVIVQLNIATNKIIVKAYEVGDQQPTWEVISQDLLNPEKKRHHIDEYFLAQDHEKIDRFPTKAISSIIKLIQDRFIDIILSADNNKYIRYSEGNYGANQIVSFEKENHHKILSKTVQVLIDLYQSWLEIEDGQDIIIVHFFSKFKWIDIMNQTIASSVIKFYNSKFVRDLMIKKFPFLSEGFSIISDLNQASDYINKKYELLKNKYVLKEANEIFKILDEMISEVENDKENHDSNNYEESLEICFDQSLRDYLRQYPDSLVSNFSELSTNYNLCWVPSTKFINLKSGPANKSSYEWYWNLVKQQVNGKFVVFNPYQSRDVKIKNKAVFLSEVYKYILEVTEPQPEEIDLKETSYIDPVEEKFINKGNIKFAPQPIGKNSILYRNGEYYLSPPSLIENKGMKENSNYMRENGSQFSRLMEILKISTKDKNKQKKMNEISLSKLKEMKTNIVGEHGEHEDYQEEYTKLRHEHKIVAHNNQLALDESKSIVRGLKNLLISQSYQRSNKLDTIINEYQEIKQELFLDSLDELSNEDIDIVYQALKKVNILNLAEDYMQISKGIALADHFAKKDVVKIIQCPNPCMYVYAFKGDGLHRKSESGTPYFQVNLVHKDLVDDYKLAYKREIAGYWEGREYFIFLHIPMRLNKTRILSLMKFDSKVISAFSLYMSNTILSPESSITRHTGQAKINDFVYDNIDSILDIAVGSIYSCSVTKLSRLGIIDFVRYSGFLPMGDYCKILDYIKEKFDPEITNLLDLYYLNNIKRMLRNLNDTKLEKLINTVKIIDVDEIEGGISNHSFYCPITNQTVLNVKSIYNNLFMAIYCLPKNMHGHYHNLISLLKVPAEYELKFRRCHEFGRYSEIYPKKSMFDGKGMFKINIPVFLVASIEYLNQQITQTTSIRNNIIQEEKMLSPIYKIDTLTSTKKCNTSDINWEDPIRRILDIGIQIDVLSNREISVLKVMRYIVNESRIELKQMISNAIDNYRNDIGNAKLYVEFLEICNHYFSDKSNEFLHKIPKIKVTKIHHKEGSEVQMYLDYLWNIYCKRSPGNFYLKSQPVSDALFDLLTKKFIKADLDTLIKHRETSGITKFNEVFSKILLEEIDKSVSLISIFEKHQRTKTDREIYLMSYKQKIKLYYMEHIMKHVAKCDNGEAISISGEHKIKHLSELVTRTLTFCSSVANSSDSYCNNTYLSTDQSKWSAGDLLYKYPIFSWLLNFLTMEEIMPFMTILDEYKNKKLVIPIDIYTLFKQKRNETNLKNDPLRELTDNFTTNNFTVSNNWLQGNLNYFSSVLHSVALLGCDIVINKFIEQLGYHFQMNWMVHSDDSVISGIVYHLNESAICLPEKSNIINKVIKNDWDKYFFLIIKNLMKNFSITMNEKKSQSSRFLAEFISERNVNGDSVPLYARNAANCCTESSHLSYYDDVCALGVNIMQLIRKKAPIPVIFYSYVCTQIQCLSIYSMLPGESNDVKNFFPLLKRTEIPIVLGGYFSSDILFTGSNGVSLDDIRKLDILVKKVENNDALKILKSIHKYCLETNLLDNMQTGSRSKLFSDQVFHYIYYGDERKLKGLSTFKYACKQFPVLRDLNHLKDSLKALESNDMELEPGTLRLISLMFKYPECYLMSPNDDFSYIMTKIVNYINFNYRKSITMDDTENLAFDRMIKSRSNAFLYQGKYYSYNRYCQILFSKDNLAEICLEDTIEKINKLIELDPIYLKTKHYKDNIIPQEATTSKSTKFKFIKPESYFKVIDTSPGLIVIYSFYGQLKYIDPNTKFNMTLGECQELLKIFITNDEFELVLKYSRFEAEGLLNRTNREISLNLYKCLLIMRNATDKLMLLNTCLNKKSFPAYVNYKLGLDYFSNLSSLMSTILSYHKDIYLLNGVILDTNTYERLFKIDIKNITLKDHLNILAWAGKQLEDLFTIRKKKFLLNYLKNICLYQKNCYEYARTECIRIENKWRESNCRRMDPNDTFLSDYIGILLNLEIISEEFASYLYKTFRSKKISYLKEQTYDINSQVYTGEYHIAKFDSRCIVELKFDDFWVNPEINVYLMTINSTYSLPSQSIAKTAILEIVWKAIKDTNLVIRKDIPTNKEILEPHTAAVMIYRGKDSSSRHLRVHANISEMHEERNNVFKTLDIKYWYIPEKEFKKLNIICRANVVKVDNSLTRVQLIIDKKIIESMSPNHSGFLQRFLNMKTFRDYFPGFEDFGTRRTASKFSDIMTVISESLKNNDLRLCQDVIRPGKMFLGVVSLKRFVYKSINIDKLLKLICIAQAGMDYKAINNLVIFRDLFDTDPDAEVPSFTDLKLELTTLRSDKPVLSLDMLGLQEEMKWTTEEKNWFNNQQLESPGFASMGKIKGYLAMEIQTGQTSNYGLKILFKPKEQVHDPAAIINYYKNIRTTMFYPNYTINPKELLCNIITSILMKAMVSKDDLIRLTIFENWDDLSNLMRSLWTDLEKLKEFIIIMSIIKVLRTNSELIRKYYASEEWKTITRRNNGIETDNFNLNTSLKEYLDSWQSLITLIKDLDYRMLEKRYGVPVAENHSGSHRFVTHKSSVVEDWCNKFLNEDNSESTEKHLQMLKGFCTGSKIIIVRKCKDIQEKLLEFKNRSLFTLYNMLLREIDRFLIVLEHINTSKKFKNIQQEDIDVDLNLDFEFE